MSIVGARVRTLDRLSPVRLDGLFDGFRFALDDSPDG
jgi:hypothetical protein